MRMWMCDTTFMCNSHLFGEHVETHMFVGTIIKGKKLDGYVRNNLLEFQKLKERHDQLAEEITRRGFNHKSQLIIPSIPNIYPEFIINSIVDKSKALKDLLTKCFVCYSKFIELRGEHDLP